MRTFAYSFPKSTFSMNLITKIKAPILNELQVFEKTFADSLHSSNLLLSDVNEYVRRGNGKQLRPVLVLLGAKICGKINQSTINCAVGTELLHTASLIHDDVVDDTLERRGQKSVNAQWNNRIAVLSGDYMFANAARYVVKTKNNRILELYSNAAMQLVYGEFLQLTNMEQSKMPDEEDYFNIIRKKTALLFSACTEIGALSVDAGENALKALRSYGECLGICFQLKDDIFDYYENLNIGKPTGNDVRDGKITLPLIYALRNAAENEKQPVLDIISRKDFSEKNIQTILHFAREKGGIAYAEQQMEFFKQKAAAELAIFPDSEVKNALLTSAEFAVVRES